MPRSFRSYTAIPHRANPQAHPFDRNPSIGAAEARRHGEKRRIHGGSTTHRTVTFPSRQSPPSLLCVLSASVVKPTVYYRVVPAQSVVTVPAQAARRESTKAVTSGEIRPRRSTHPRRTGGTAGMIGRYFARRPATTA